MNEIEKKRLAESFIEGLAHQGERLLSSILADALSSFTDIVP